MKTMNPFGPLAIALLVLACDTSTRPETAAEANTVPANEEKAATPVDATEPAAETPSLAATEQPTSTPEEKMSTATTTNANDGLYAIIKTNKGTIKAKLEMEKTPVTVASFVGLAEGTVTNTFRGQGKPYFDGLQFHRVIKNFMIQGGDPSGNGSGGPGYQFDNEIVPDLKHDRAGILSMANAGPNTNGSQFFITHTATSFLDGGYTVFGHVVEGLNVVDAIATTPTQPGDRPVQPMIMESVRIERVGAAAKAFDAAAVLKQNAKKVRAAQR